MTKVYDPGFTQRLLRLLQARGTSPEVDTDLNVLGLVVSIPAHEVLERARGSFGGALHEPSVADPAVGANLSIAVPANEFWVPRTLRLLLTTSATAINRKLRLQHTDSSLARFYWTTSARRAAADNTDQPASTGWQYSWAPGMQPHDSGTDHQTVAQAMPYPVVLKPGDVLRTLIVNIQAGDAITSVFFLVERYQQ